MRGPLQLTVCLLGGLALAVSGCGGSSPKKTTTTVASASTGTTAQATTPSPSGGSTAPNGGATSPSGGSTGPSGGSTGPSGGSTGPSGGRAGNLTRAEESKKAAEARLLREKLAAQRRIAQIRARYRSKSPAEKHAVLEATKRASAKHRPYPEYVKAKFTTTCENAKGSPSQCACILSKQAFSKVESALAFAELVALEVAFEKGTTIQGVVRPQTPLPEGVRIHVQQCVSGK